MPRGFRPATAAFAFVLLATLVTYRETLASFVHVWRNSATFAHGFLIVPICAYLIWRKRRTLESLTPRPYPPALLLLPLLGLAWLVGHATGTLLVEQLSFVAMVPALVVVFFGPQVARSQAFALGYLFFAVPFGTGFQPSLMDFTADFAVRALQISGVPVVREGLYFATPGAKWRIVEACSGLHFLVAGLALACLYAYWVYQKPWKRLAFAGCAIAALVIANGVRAYAIVLVGYLTHMRLSMGLEHNAIGWAIFMVVMAALFAVGSRFRDPAPSSDTASGVAEGGPFTPPSARPARWIRMAAVSMVAIGFWPLLVSHLARTEPGRPAAAISAPEPRDGWALEPDHALDWRPAYVGASSETARAYTKDGATVQCYLAFYDRQQEGRELIQYQNVIVVTRDPRWHNRGERDRRIPLGRETIVVRETDVRDPSTRLLVWHWYWVPDEFTASREWAKLLQARASLILRRDHAAVVVLSTPAVDDRDAAEDLQRFAGDMLPSIRKALLEAEGVTERSSR